MFELFFLIGLLGFLAMAGLSSLHGNGHGHSHSGGHGGEGALHHGHGHALGHGHAAGHGASHVLDHGGGHGADHSVAKPVGGLSEHGSTNKTLAESGRTPPFWISPIDIFAYSMGFGATGLLLRGTALFAFAIPIAFVGGALFNYGIIKPLMGFLLGFASKPSDGLEGTVGKAGEAITRFDEAGDGLIRLSLDDEYVQLLAHLDRDELKSGVRVLKGDPVLVLSVDPAKNTCRVSREMAG